MTMKLIQHTELSSPQASIVFNSIPQTYTDLWLVTSLRDTTANAGWAYAYIYPNGSGTNISSRFLFGWSTNVGSTTDTNFYHQLSRGASTASVFSSSSVYVTNYTLSRHKSVQIETSSERNDLAAINAITAGLWSNNTAISSLQIVPEAGSFAAGSSATLYGITAAAVNIATVS